MNSVLVRGRRLAEKRLKMFSRACPNCHCMSDAHFLRLGLIDGKGLFKFPIVILPVPQQNLPVPHRTTRNRRLVASKSTRLREVLQQHRSIQSHLSIIHMRYRLQSLHIQVMIPKIQVGIVILKFLLLLSRRKPQPLISSGYILNPAIFRCL